MTKAAKKEAGPKAGPASSSSNGHKEVKWGDLTFELPEELPLSISFDLAGVGGLFADQRFLNSILGTDQMMLLRDQLDEDKVRLDPKGTKVLGTLIEDILSEYGFDVGEASASSSASPNGET